MGLGSIGMGEMIFMFLIVLLLFGAKRLPEIGSSLGKGIREFKSSVREIEHELKVPTDRQIHRTSAPPEPVSETKDDDRRALLLRLVARSEERSGEDRAAGITWRLLWYAHPTSREAEQASHRLDLIEAHLGEQLLARVRALLDHLLGAARQRQTLFGVAAPEDLEEIGDRVGLFGLYGGSPRLAEREQ